MKLSLAAACLAAAPLPALAQSWPATVVASGPRMALAPAPTLVRVDRDARLLRRLTLPPTHPTAKLRLSAAEDVPQVDLRPKDAWTDDQGLRVSATRLAFKRRF